MNSNRKAANLDWSPPANNESGVVFPTQAAWVHVRPQADVVPQDVCNPLFCADIVDFNSLKRNQTLAFSHWILYFLLLERVWSLTTLLAQAMRLALHWMLVIEPSPSWSTDVFQRFNQFLSYRSSFGEENRKTFNTTRFASQVNINSWVQLCSPAYRGQ